MSDNYTDDDLDFEADESSDIRSLRRAANAAKRLKAENAQMKRELAFAKAGIALDDPKMRYFVKGYDGELEADVIREAATEAGFIQVEASQEQAPDPNMQAAASAQQRVMAASAGATSEDISEEAALSRMEAAMQEGGIEAMLDVARQYGIPTQSEY
jgi:hypothetical protein